MVSLFLIWLFSCNAGYLAVTFVFLKGTDPVAQLDADTLRLLGNEGGELPATSPPIHKDLVPIWSSILKNGLKEDTRDSLVAKYPRPENCLLVAPPKINPEVKAAVNEVASKRDARYESLQAMLGASLSALGQAVTLILSSSSVDECKSRLLSSLGDAARLVAGVHQQQSQARRLTLKSQLNVSLAATLSETPSDDSWLFGENLSQRIQSAKVLHKMTAELRKPKEPVKPPLANRLVRSKIPPGNFNGPPRPQHRSLRRGGPRTAAAVTRNQQKPQLPSSRGMEYRRRH